MAKGGRRPPDLRRGDGPPLREGRPHRSSRAGPEAFDRALSRTSGPSRIWRISTRSAANVARSKETLDTFLAKVEDHGLDHAKIRVAIADDLMSERPLCRGVALCGSRRPDLGGLGDDVCPELRRGPRELGSRRGVCTRLVRALPAKHVGRLVPLLRTDRARRHRRGPYVDQGVCHGPAGKPPAVHRQLAPGLLRSTSLRR